MVLIYLSMHDSFKFVTEIDIFLCSKNKTIVYVESPLINSATFCDLVGVACMWLYVKCKNTWLGLAV